MLFGLPLLNLIRFQKSYLVTQIVTSYKDLIIVELNLELITMQDFKTETIQLSA